MTGVKEAAKNQQDGAHDKQGHCQEYGLPRHATRELTKLKHEVRVSETSGGAVGIGVE